MAPPHGAFSSQPPLSSAIREARKDGQSYVTPDADDCICNTQGKQSEAGLSSTTTESTQARALLGSIHHKITEIVAVRDEVVETLLVAVLAHGHAMIEGIPGIGKT